MAESASAGTRTSVGFDQPCSDRLWKRLFGLEVIRRESLSAFQAWALPGPLIHTPHTKQDRGPEQLETLEMSSISKRSKRRGWEWGKKDSIYLHVGRIVGFGHLFPAHLSCWRLELKAQIARGSCFGDSGGEKKCINLARWMSQRTATTAGFKNQTAKYDFLLLFIYLFPFDQTHRFWSCSE